MSITLERPIQNSADDLLDRSTFIQRLAQTLVSVDGNVSSGVVLGICGEWGSGKSSLLNLLADHLREKDGATVVQFDPWLISGRDDLVTRLLQQLASELSDQSMGEKARNIGAKLFEYVEALSPVADAGFAAASVVAPGAGIVAKWAASKARTKLTKPTDLPSKRRKLEEVLEKAEKPIIVMIDELDRLEDNEIRAMAQLVRSVADFPQISYVLAYDPRRVAEALGADAGDKPEDRIKRGAAYLEKIVQFQIPLPTPSAAELIRLADQVISEIAKKRGLPGNWGEQPDCDQLIRLMIPNLLRTPRDIKRWSGLFKAQEAMFFGEVDWVDLLALSALMTKAPRTVENIRQRPQLVGVQLPDYPYDEYVMDFVRETKKTDEERREMQLEHICASGERRGAIDELIGFIFPSLSSPYTQRRSDSPDRLFRHRPFMTVLRYGIPPGHFSRTDILAFLNASFADRKKQFECAIETRTGPSFVARLAEVYSEEIEVDHIALWKDIAEIQRKGDMSWLQKVPERDISDEFARALSRRAKKDFLPIAQEIINELSQLQDKEILPCCIYAHMWGHGLFGLEQRGGDDRWLTPSFVEEMAHKIGTEFSEGFLRSHHLLSASWHMYPYYVAHRSGHWSKDCRDAATEALRDIGYLDALVIMMFGNNNATSRQQITAMLDFDAFMLSAEVRMEDRDFSRQDISLQAAYASMMRRMPEV